MGLEWTFDTRRGQTWTLVNGIPQLLTPTEAVSHLDSLGQPDLLFAHLRNGLWAGRGNR